MSALLRQHRVISTSVELRGRAPGIARSSSVPSGSGDSSVPGLAMRVVVELRDGSVHARMADGTQSLRACDTGRSMRRRLDVNRTRS